MAKYIRYKFMGRDLIDWNIEEYSYNGYKRKTTYYTDFGIAEPFGLDAIRDTYDTAVKHWGNNIEWMTEIVMVLNWKIWEHFHSGHDALARFYDGLWREASQYVREHFSGDDLAYYYEMTD